MTTLKKFTLEALDSLAHSLIASVKNKREKNMRVRRLAVTLAACCLQVRPAAADESINIFVAIDAAYYLGLVLCGMVRAYGEPSSAARRGRPFKFFVLY